MPPPLPPPPPPEVQKGIRNNSAGGGGGGGAEGWGVPLELIGTIMQIRSRGLWDLGNKDDGVCYECNWKMVKSGRFCTRTPPFTISAYTKLHILVLIYNIAYPKKVSLFDLM